VLLVHVVDREFFTADLDLEAGQHRFEVIRLEVRLWRALGGESRSTRRQGGHHQDDRDERAWYSIKRSHGLSLPFMTASTSNITPGTVVLRNRYSANSIRSATSMPVNMPSPLTRTDSWKVTNWSSNIRWGAMNSWSMCMSGNWLPSAKAYTYMSEPSKETVYIVHATSPSTPLSISSASSISP